MDSERSTSMDTLPVPGATLFYRGGAGPVLSFCLVETATLMPLIPFARDSKSAIRL